MVILHRCVILVVALLFVGLGCWLMLQPLAVESLYPVRLEGSMAISEIRAVFGGLMMGIGMGVVWLIWPLRRDMEAAAVTLFVFGGLLIARIAGLHGEGMPHGPVLNETIFEAVVFCLVLVTTLKTRNRK